MFRETAFVHAITAAALTHAVSRACSDGRMMRCQCGKEKHPDETRLAWKWGGCSDNLKHGKRIARNFLNLNQYDGDEVSEVLRHDSEVGIQAVVETMIEKCKCHGVSGSCSMKTCYKKVGSFNATAAHLRVKYHNAQRRVAKNKPARRSAPSKLKKQKNVKVNYSDFINFVKKKIIFIKNFIFRERKSMIHFTILKHHLHFVQ